MFRLSVYHYTGRFVYATSLSKSRYGAPQEFLLTPFLASRD